jgi:hypothetical protein
MPFDSKRQGRFFFANPEKLGGIDKVMEWARETNYKKIPERARKSKPSMGPPAKRKKK